MGQLSYQLNSVISNYQNWLNTLQRDYNFTPQQLRNMPFETKKQISDWITNVLTDLERTIESIRNSYYQLNSYINDCSRALSELDSERWRISSGNYEAYSKSQALANIDRQKYDIRSKKDDAQSDYYAASRAIDQLNSIKSAASNFRWRLMGNY